MNSEVPQLYINMYPFSALALHLGCHSIQAAFLVLYSRTSLVIPFKDISYVFPCFTQDAFSSYQPLLFKIVTFQSATRVEDSTSSHNQFLTEKFHMDNLPLVCQTQTKTDSIILSNPVLPSWFHMWLAGVPTTHPNCPIQLIFTLYPFSHW